MNLVCSTPVRHTARQVDVSRHPPRNTGGREHIAADHVLGWLHRHHAAKQ